LGVRRAFDERQADLSGIGGRRGDLVISEVVQKSFVNVSEGGVEAAAATSVSNTAPASASTAAPKDFTVDRPFLFYIKIKKTVVLIGRVADPTL
jgi:serpin B